jgi:hypothetical protein
MNTVLALLVLLTTHFIADFPLQNDWMALNKSKRMGALLCHTLIYSMCFFYCGISFMLVTFLLHTLTDFITSRINSKLWLAEKRHWFFVCIGFDQLLHAYQLLLTWEYLK